jgi:hypothetical protein
MSRQGVTGKVTGGKSNGDHSRVVANVNTLSVLRR